MEKIIQLGAEAEIILSRNKIIKRRVPKFYRLKELDEKIRKLRTRSETKLLEKASKIVNVPKILNINVKDLSKMLEVGGWKEGIKKNNFEIQMQFIKGKRLSENLDKFPLKKQKEICRKIGENISKLHDSNIIHGDLTTSNMIYFENFNKEKNKNNKSKNSLKEVFRDNNSLGVGWWEKGSFSVFFIDFGLGFISHKIEDKAVDLHLLKEALEAKHFQNWKILFNEVLKGYKVSKHCEKVVEQMRKVESRGRYKEKY
ncbi:Kae1-associated serine/threonine protein kinase [Candidatus Pacearchaeota archaeon]|nr:Kae1-associated serine/threonine protein kinase [Candidatus Pacearchaeota archaeon]